MPWRRTIEASRNATITLTDILSCISSTSHTIVTEGAARAGGRRRSNRHRTPAWVWISERASLCLTSKVTDPTVYVNHGSIAYFTIRYRSQYQYPALRDRPTGRHDHRHKTA
jgi:hypothetical protein